MTINITTDTTGQIGVNPRIVKIVCNDTLATITTAGYLNGVIAEGATILPTDLILINYANYACGQFSYVASSQTLVPCFPAITVPTVANDIAVFGDTHGNIIDGSAITAAAGGLQAGYSGTAGVVTSYPTTPASGKLKLAAVNSSGDYAVTVSNASHGQATVASIPDSGQATTKFVLTDNAATQHVTTGSLQVDAGNVSAGLAAGGTAGTVISYSATGSKGSLILAAVANTGNTNTTISNVAMGQASVISIPDPGAATSNFVVTQSSLPSNNVAFTKVITAGFAALATAGKINIAVHPSGTSKFAILDIKVLNSTGLSGGGGNRLLSVSDGTIVFNGSGITAALLGTPICTVWGGTGNPIASGTSQVSTAGADIFLQYVGGTTDYTAGSVQLAITLVQTVA